MEDTRSGFQLGGEKDTTFALAFDMKFDPNLLPNTPSADLIKQLNEYLEQYKQNSRNVEYERYYANSDMMKAYQEWIVAAGKPQQTATELNFRKAQRIADLLWRQLGYWNRIIKETEEFVTDLNKWVDEEKAMDIEHKKAKEDLPQA